MAVVFCLIYYVSDFLIDLLRRLKSPDRLDGDENSMFRRQLVLLEENFSCLDSQLRCPSCRCPGCPLGSSLDIYVIHVIHEETKSMEPLKTIILSTSYTVLPISCSPIAQESRAFCENCRNISPDREHYSH